MSKFCGMCALNYEILLLMLFMLIRFSAQFLKCDLKVKYVFLCCCCNGCLHE